MPRTCRAGIVSLAVLALTAAPSWAAPRPERVPGTVAPIPAGRGEDAERLRAARDLRSLPPAEAAARLAEFRTRTGPSRRAAGAEVHGAPSRPVRLSAAGPELAPHGAGLDPALVGLAETVTVLIEFTRSLDLDDLIALLEAGIPANRSLSDRLILSVANPVRLESAMRLAFVRGITRVTSVLKVAPVGPGARDEGELYVKAMVPGDDAQRRDLEAAGFPVLSYDPGTFTWQVTGSLARMRDVAALAWVEAVSPRRRPVARTLRVPHGGSGYNFEPDDSRELLSAPWIWSGQAGDSKAGAGVLVGVMDDGLKTDHPDFPGSSLHVATNAGTPGDHGTHVAGTVTGRGTRAIPDGRYNVRGVAPDATLLFRGDLNAWATNRVSFANNNCLISNHSWGASWSADRALLTYDADCQSFDAWMSETGLLLVPAAGNDGEQLAAATVGSPSNAKNPLTVGAIYYVVTGTAGESVGYITDYSSRGPTRDVDTNTVQGRLQPTIMAPGGNTANAGIIAPNKGGYTAWYSDSQYAHSGGTSMAAPHVTGAATLVKQAFPSADANLLKALLVNTAIPLRASGSTAGNGYATRFYGYGLVNPFSAIYDVAGECVRVRGETGTLAKTGTDSLTYSMTVNAGAKLLAVTMAYNDDPGLQSVSVGDSTSVLYEDLDLVVIAPGGGTEYRYDLAALSGEGVIFQQPLEKIGIENPAAGNWTARVEYRKSTTGGGLGTRRFAIVGHAYYKDPVVRASVSETVTANPGDTFAVTVTFTNIGGCVAAGVTARISQLTGAGTITGHKDTTYFINNLPYGNASDSRYWIFTAPAETGVYTMRITTGMANRGVPDTAIVFNVANGVPSGIASVDTSGPNAWYVNDTATTGDSFTSAVGSNANDGLTRATPKRTLNALEGLLTAGDTVYVDGGFYYEPDTVTISCSSVSILGRDSASTVIDFGDTSVASARSLYAANLTRVTLSDLRVTRGRIGVWWRNVDSSIIQNVRVDSHSGRGILLDASTESCLLSGCAVSGNGAEGVVVLSNFNTIAGSRATGNTKAGYVLDNTSQRNTITQSTASGNGEAGFSLIGLGDQYQTLHQNTALQNGDGGFNLSSSHRNTLMFNTATGNAASNLLGDGFYVFASDTNLLAENVSIGNVGSGFDVQSSSFNTVRNNLARWNKDAGFVVQDNSATAADFNVFHANTADSNANYAFHVIDAGLPSVGDTFTKNVLITSPTRPDSGVFCSVRSARFDFTRNYWSRMGSGTIDSSVIRGMTGGVGRDSIAWSPYRLGRVDTSSGADTVAPRAPDTVAASSLSSSSIRVSWSSSSGAEEPEAVTLVTGFAVYRATAPASSLWTQVGTVGAAARSYDDGGLSFGSTYYYKVTATDSATPYPNESWFSDSTASASTGLMPTPPLTETGAYDTIVTGALGSESTQTYLGQGNVDTMRVTLPTPTGESWIIRLDLPDTGNRLGIRLVPASDMNATDTSQIRGYAFGFANRMELTLYDSAGNVRSNAYWAQLNDSPMLVFHVRNSGLDTRRVVLYWLNTSDSKWYDVTHPSKGISRGQGYVRNGDTISIRVDHFSHFFPGEGLVDTVSVVLADTVVSRNTDRGVAHQSLMVLAILGDTGGGGDTITSFTVANAGTLDTNHVTNVRIVRDSNANRQFDTGVDVIEATLPGTAARTWSASGLAIRLGVSAETFLVIADIAGNATVGGTIQLQVPAYAVGTADETSGPVVARTNPGTWTVVDTSGPNAWYVNDTSTTGDSFTSSVGATSNSGLSRSAPKRNVFELRNLLTAGDSVYIDAGLHYNESKIIVTVSGVTFLGVDSRVTVLDANYETGFWLQGADRTRIQDLAIINADLTKDGGLGQYGAGIYVQNADSVSIVSDSFLSNANSVEATAGTESLTITGSWFGTCQNWGFYSETASRTVLTGNAFSGGSIGLYARSDSARVVGNTFTGGRTVVVEATDSALVAGNILSGNSEITITGGRRNYVLANTILDGKIVVNSGSTYTHVLDNACTIVGATSIDYYGESGVVSGNAVYGSGGGGYGIWLRTNAYGNVVRNNLAHTKRNYGFLVQGNNNHIDSNRAYLCQDGGFWLGSAGDTNLVTNNLADRTSGVGFQVDRFGNMLRGNQARENSAQGFRVIGQSNVLRQNLADSNLGYGLSVVAGNILDRNAIRTSPVRSDSGLYADTTQAVDAARTWWFTTDSAVILGRIRGPGRGVAIYTPFRLGIMDTAVAGDTVAPAAPGAIAADSPNGVIRITWSAPTVNEDSSATPGVSFYRVFRARAADTTDWCAVVGETTGLEFRDTTAASDTDYYYRVVAVDAASVPNASFYSGVVRGRGVADNEPPVVTLQKPTAVAINRAATITAALVDTGLGVASARLHARAALAADTATAYTSWAMTLEAGSSVNGTWTASVPDTVIGTDTSKLLFLYVACTDVLGRSTTTAAETVPIASGVDARVYLGNARGETTEVTGSVSIATTNGSLSFRVTSSIGDTVQVYRVPAGGMTTQRLAFQPNFADSSFALAGPFGDGDSVVVAVFDTTIALAFAETYIHRADATKPAIASFTLDPSRAAVDSTGVYVRIGFAALEAHARVFVWQTGDTAPSAAVNDTTRVFTGTTVDSSNGLSQVRVTVVTGDTITLYAGAWDLAGNVADTVRLEFRIDRAGPVPAITAVANNRPPSETVTITATITDTTLDLGLQSVTLGVRTPDAVTDSYAMTALGGGTYRATVPGSKNGATAGTVTLNVTALDTFGQKGNAIATFTIASVSLQIADTGQSFAAVDTIWSQAITGYIRIFGSGDTVRVTNATAGVAQPDTATTSSGASTDTVLVPVPLLAGVNRVVVTRISAAGDSASFTRWFVADTTAPVLTSVLLDTNAAATGSTTCVLTFASADSFAVAAYRVLGATTDSSYTFLGFSGAATFYRTITLTSGSGFKSVSVEVRDTAGNISSGLADTIELVVGAGTVITPTFNAGAGETQALVTRTLVDQVSETVTILQGGSDTVITYILQRGTDGDTIRLLIDFADTVRNSRTVVSVPDTNPLAASADSISLIADFAAGYRTIREIIVTDSLGNPIGAASEIFNSVRLTWHLDSTLASRKSALEIFFWDTPSRRWLYARTFDSVVNRGARDSFVNYATGDTISIVVRHFTIYAVFPAGGFTQTSVQNVVVFPNPYVPYDGNLANGEAGSAFAEGIYIGNIPAGSSVEIFDVRGRKMAEMTPAEVAANANGLVRWNARNRDNQEVASGVYLIVVKGPGGTAVRKAAVVR